MSRIKLHTSGLNSYEVSQDGLLLTPPQKSAAGSCAGSKRSVRKVSSTSHDKRSHLDFREDFQFPQTNAFNPDTFDSASLLQSMSPKSSLLQPQSSVNFLEHNILMVKRMPHQQANSSSPTKSSTPKHSCNVQERFYDYQAAIDLKLKHAREAQAQAEAALCPFKPTTRRTELQRSPAQVYKDLMKFETRRLSRLQEQREQDPEDLSCSFRPEICAKSQRMVESKPYMSIKCEERLYEMYKTGACRDSTVSSTYSEDVSKYTDASTAGVLKLTKMSRELVRTEPIEDRLYNEALRRREPKTSEELPHHVPVSTKSLNLLVKRFLTEFTVHTRSLDDRVNYCHFVNVLRAMGFAQVSRQKPNEQTVTILKLWNQLAGDASCISVADLKAGLMGVMGYYQSWMSDPSRQTLLLTQADVRKYHDQYITLFKNRMNSAPKKSTHSETLTTKCTAERTNKHHEEQPEQQLEELAEQQHEPATESNVQSSLNPSQLLHSWVADKLAKVIAERSKGSNASDTFDGISAVPVATVSLDLPALYQPANTPEGPKKSRFLTRTYTMSCRDLLHLVEGNERSPIPVQELPSAFADSFRNDESQESSVLRATTEQEEVSVALTTNGGPASLRLSTIQNAELSVEAYAADHDLSRQEAERLLRNIQGLIPKF